MATKIVCDGCGDTQMPYSEFRRLGIVIQKDYCEECADIIEEFIEQRDRLHNEVAGTWSEKLMALKDEFRGKIGHGALPDEL